MKKDIEWVKNEMFEAAWGMAKSKYLIHLEDAYKIIDQLDEPEKVVVPEFVAETLADFTKGEFGDKPGENSVFNFIGNLKDDFKKGYHRETKEWFYESLQNQIDIEMAWLNGYTVEEMEEVAE